MKKFLVTCATVCLAFEAGYNIYQTWKRCYGDDNGDDDSNDAVRIKKYTTIFHRLCSY